MTALSNILLYFMAAIVLSMCVYAYFILRSYKKTLKDLEETKEELAREKHHDEADFHFKQKVGAELEKSADEARAELKAIGKKVGEELKEKLQGKVSAIDKAAGEAVSMEFDHAREEITEYKRGKITEIDTKAKQILSEVVREALGKSLDDNQKQDLVASALNDAKRRNLF